MNTFQLKFDDLSNIFSAISKALIRPTYVLKHRFRKRFGKRIRVLIFLKSENIRRYSIRFGIDSACGYVSIVDNYFVARITYLSIPITRGFHEV